MQANYVQRMRVTFRKVGPTRFIGHLDVQRTWERALNRAKVPMAYTQGFNRRPRMQLASALPLGYTSECEMIDLWLGEMCDPAQLQTQLVERMAPGLEIVSVVDVALKQPALPAQIEGAHYLGTLKFVEITFADLESRVQAFLAQDEIMRSKPTRKNPNRMYDLRQLVLNLEAQDTEPHLGLQMHVMSQQGLTGRPDEILSVLEIDPYDVHMHRTGLVLAEAE